MKKLSIALIGLLFFFAALSPAVAAESPWESWKNGYNAYREGERLKLKGDDEAAARQFAVAKQFYIKVREMRPDWNQKIIAGRIADCDRAIAAANPGAAAPKTEPKIESKPIAARPAAAAPTPAATQTVDSAEAAKLRAEVELLRKNLSDRTRKLHANAEVVNSLLEDQKLMRGKYALLEKRYKQLQTAAAAPDRKSEELKNALLEAKLNLELAEKRCAIAEDKLKKSSGELENFELFRKKSATELRNAENRIKLLRSEKEAFSKALSEAAENAKAAADAAAARTKLIETQAEQLAADKAELKKLNQRLDEAISSGTAGGKMQKTLTDDNTKLRAEVTKLREALERSEKIIADRIPTEKLMTAELTGLSAKLKAAETANAKLKKDMENFNRVSERDRSALAAALLETKNLRERNAQTDAELKGFADKNAELTRKLAAFTSADLVSAKSAADRESKLAAEITKLTAALKEEKQASVNAAETVKKLRNEMAELAKLEKYKTESEILKDALKQARASLAAVEKKAEEAATLAVQLEESEKLREKLAAQAAELAQREAEAARIAKLPPRLEAAAPETLPAGDVTVDDLMDSAQKCEKGERPSVALWYYRYAMQLYPEEASPAAGAAKLLLKYGENQGAENCIASARAAGADSLELITLHGRSLNRQGEWSKAYLVLEPVRVKGDHFDFDLELAVSQAGTGRIELAKNTFDTLLKKADDLPEVKLAYAYFAKDKLKDRAAAESAYRSYRKQGGAPDPDLDGEFAAPPEEETLDFLAAAAAEAEAAADWESAAWFHLRRLDIRKDSPEFAARGAFDLYRAGRYAACAEILMMNRPSAAGMLLLSAARFRLGDFAAASEEAASCLKGVRLGEVKSPAPWPELLGEIAKLEDNDTTRRSARAIRRAAEAVSTQK